MFGADARAITVRGAAQGTSVVDCQHFGPDIQGVVRGTHLRLEQIQFTNAHRTGSGGAVVRAEEDSHIVLDGCRVTNCGTDGEGGALLVHSSSLLVVHSHFEEISAEAKGGALAVVNRSAATVSDSTFTRCIAGSGGGAVFVADSTLQSKGMRCSLNDAGPGDGGKGGAVLVSDSSTVNASATTINDNLAFRGGGFMVQFSSLLGLKDVRCDLCVCHCVHVLISVCGLGQTIAPSNARLLD